MENPVKKGELIIPPSNFFHKSLRRDVVKISNKKATETETQANDVKDSVEKRCDNIPNTYDDEWDHNPYDDQIEEDPLAQYTVVAGVIMPSVSSKPSVSQSCSSSDTTDSRRSKVPGGWGLTPGQQWKPVELPKPSTPVKVQTCNGERRKLENKCGPQNENKGKKKNKVEDDAASDPLIISKEIFMQKMKTKFTSCHAIVYPTGIATVSIAMKLLKVMTIGECTIVSGSPRNVKINAEMRKGNKVSVRVYEKFDVYFQTMRVWYTFYCAGNNQSNGVGGLPH